MTSTTKRLYLIGGSSGAGKTTTALMLRKDLRCGWLQADTIWRALQSFLPAGSPEHTCLQVDEEIRRGGRTAEELTRQHVEAARLVCRALEGAVQFELRTTYDTLIVDGAWLLPRWIANLDLSAMGADVRAVILHEPDAAEVKRAMRQRWSAIAGPLPETLPRQRLGAAVSALYGDWLRSEADRHGIPVVDARPRDTLFDRLKRALEVPVRS